MPVPISPNSYYMHDGGSQGVNSGWHNIDVSSLLNNVHTIQDSILPDNRRPSTLNKLASDQDANLLMDVWNKSSIITSGSNIKDKTYQPCDVDPMSLNRLETAGLITNHGNKIRFTNRAASIIKTIVLSETNQFLKRSVKKPYSMILADNHNSKKKTLALTNKVASSNHQPNQLQAFALANIEIPGKSSPTPEQPYFFNRRFVKIDEHSQKEYTIRIYVGDEFNYELWAFHGKIGARQRPQPKGGYDTRISAENNAAILANAKQAKGYVSALNANMSDVNPDIPGVPMPVEASTYHPDDFARTTDKSEIDVEQAKDVHQKAADVIVNNFNTFIQRLKGIAHSHDRLKNWQFPPYLIEALQSPRLSQDHIQAIINAIESIPYKVIQRHNDVSLSIANHKNVPVDWAVTFFSDHPDLFKRHHDSIENPEVVEKAEKAIFFPEPDYEAEKAYWDEAFGVVGNKIFNLKKYCNVTKKNGSQRS